MTRRALDTVEVFASAKPTRPYREVLVIKAQQSSGWSTDSEMVTLDKLRERAAELGCDGVVILGPVSASDGAFMTKRGFLGTCIQYE